MRDDVCLEVEQVERTKMWPNFSLLLLPANKPITITTYPPSCLTCHDARAFTNTFVRIVRLWYGYILERGCSQLCSGEVGYGSLISTYDQTYVYVYRYAEWKAAICVRFIMSMWVSYNAKCCIIYYVGGNLLVQARYSGVSTCPTPCYFNITLIELFTQSQSKSTSML